MLTFLKFVGGFVGGVVAVLFLVQFFTVVYKILILYTVPTATIFVGVWYIAFLTFYIGLFIASVVVYKRFLHSRAVLSGSLVGLIFPLVIVGLVFLSLGGHGQGDRLRDAKRISDLRSTEPALELYYDDHGVYPDTLNLLTPGYISVLPRDPLNEREYVYTYATSETNDRYVLRARLENKKHVALDFDANGIQFGINCDGLYYCLIGP